MNQLEKNLIKLLMVNAEKLNNESETFAEICTILEVGEEEVLDVISKFNPALAGELS